MSQDQSDQTVAELRQLAATAVDSGLPDATTEQTEHDLGQRLQQQLLAASQAGETLPPWAEGNYGPTDLAKRFIEYNRPAICAALCDPKEKRLKSEYADLLGAVRSDAGTIATLAGVLLVALHVAAPQVGIPAVATYLAILTLQTGLQQWCRQCP